MFAPFDMLGHHAPGTYCIGTGVQLHNFIIGEVSIPNSLSSYHPNAKGDKLGKGEAMNGGSRSRKRK
jgi:hypothetical protein